MRRATFKLTFLTSLVFVAFAASQAQGLTISSTGTVPNATLVVTAAPGEVNDMTILRNDTPNYRVTEDGTGVTALNVTAVGCVTNDGLPVHVEVVCADTYSGVTANLADGDDTISTSQNANTDPFTLNGGPGLDELNGSLAGDTIDGGLDDDVINGGAGNDTLLGGSGDANRDVMTGGSGNDTLDGGPGIDRAMYDTSTAATTVTIDNVANDNDGLGGTDNVRDTTESITGSGFVDTYTGSCFGNTFAGQAGNDILTGDPAACPGGFGGDFFGGGAGNDVITGLGGTDTVTYTINTAAQPISVTLDNNANDSDGYGNTDNIKSDNEVIYGGAGNDTINATGAGSGVVLWGRAGVDNLIGSPFNDILRGEAGADVLNCAGGTNDMYVLDPADTSVTNCETQIQA